MRVIILDDDEQEVIKDLELQSEIYDIRNKVIKELALLVCQACITKYHNKDCNECTIMTWD